MPRFYFDFEDGLGLHTDENGTELADVRAAYAEAMRVLPCMARDWQHTDPLVKIICRVRDRIGRNVATASLTMSGSAFV